jgi:uncharacterized protein YidB (DUF937 family)
MGLLDVLTGMQNGPRGQPQPSPGSSSSGGMSPIMMAILGLIAYKAVKGLGGSQPSANPAGSGRAATPASPAGNLSADASSGGLGDLLQSGLGGLGGLLAGGSAGSILSGGLNDLIKQFQEQGHGEAANSWVGTGPNKAISPNDLASALGSDKISALMQQSGMSRSELLEGLSQELPDAIDQLTPEGRVPTEREFSRWV